jgi:ribosomal protein S7
MSRRHSAEKREINPDPKFGDLVVTKFMNAHHVHGKKSAAESIVYGAFDSSRTRLKQDPLAVFHRRSTTSLRMSKSVRAASVVRPTRFRSMFVRSAVRLSPSAG